MDTSARISTCLNFYDSIKPENSIDSYTVLASIHNHESGKLLALATGTQACLRTYPDDIVDCHAESLLKRAYKRYLIDRLTSETRNSSFDHARKELVKECLQGVTFFISQFPCGLIRRYEGQEPVDETTGLVIRRKPGRGTVIGNKMVYVEKDSCSDKLARWISGEFLGRRLQEILGTETSLIHKVIIGDCEPDENLDYCYNSEKMAESLSIEVEVVKGVRRDEFVYAPEKQPQPVALVWWDSSADDSSNLEFVVDGRKRGATKKQCLASGTKHKLKVSNLGMRQSLDAIQCAYIDTED